VQKILELLPLLGVGENKFGNFRAIELAGFGHGSWTKMVHNVGMPGRPDLNHLACEQIRINDGIASLAKKPGHS
jgi:hypothetical protein